MTDEILIGLIGLIGALIGAFIGAYTSSKMMTKQFKFMADEELKKQQREDDLYLKRKREKVYFKILQHLEYLRKEAYGLPYDADLKFKEEATLLTYIQLYAKIDTVILYHQTTKAIEILIKDNPSDKKKTVNGLVKTLMLEIRKELGIKD